MKKQLFSLVALLFCALTTTFAQSPLVATLSHNDTVSVYYGRSAFQSAYNASTHGDVITLSSGSFDVPSTITKNITIRGAGMEKDSVNNVFPTILMRDFTVYTLSDTIAGRLMMEGVYCNGTMSLGRNGTGYSSQYTLKNSLFIKCCFTTILGAAYYYNNNYPSNYVTTWRDVSFIQCLVTKSLTMAAGNPVFMNCTIFEPKKNTASASQSSTNLKCEFFNCILVDPLNIVHSEFSNSILLGSSQLGFSNVAYQCVANYTGTATGGMFANLIGNLGNVSLSDSTALFKTFRGTYSETETFELTDSAKEKYLGTDGTQVGIYGGTLPFSPQVSMPQIKKFKVASKSTDDGKLSVEIEVSAAE